jgi:predicted ATP-dependent endonuclease of OLD family
MGKMLKIQSLEIKNVKRVKHVVVTPEGWVVKITGANAQGKSSTLDALMYLLEGTNNMPEDARRSGEKKGTIEGDFGEFKITRTITEKGTRLEVIDKAGVERGQKFLNELLGNNATDVMTFVEQKPAEQRKLLAKLAGVSTEKINSDIERCYEERTFLNRDLEKAKVALSEKKLVPGLPEEEIKIADLIKRSEEIKCHNQNIWNLTKKKSETIDEIHGHEIEIQQLKKIVEEIDAELFGAEPIPETTVNKEISEIDQQNKIIRENIEYKTMQKTKYDLEERAEQKNDELEKLRSQKIKMLSEAKYPVEGLSLSDSSVIFNCVPLEEASGAEKIVIGIAILSKVLPENGIRICRVKNSPFIDKKNMDAIKDMAEKEKVQVWLELGSDEPGTGEEIFIVDGKNLDL